MPANYSHPIRTDVELVMTYPSTGPDAHRTVLHADGCGHIFRKHFSEPARYVDDGYFYSGDWYTIAPCARAPKVKASKAS
jgi:hypothetical protein